LRGDGIYSIIFELERHVRIIYIRYVRPRFQLFKLIDSIWRRGLLVFLLFLKTNSCFATRTNRFLVTARSYPPAHYHFLTRNDSRLQWRVRREWVLNTAGALLSGLIRLEFSYGRWENIKILRRVFRIRFRILNTRKCNNRFEMKSVIPSLIRYKILAIDNYIYLHARR